MTTLFRLSRGKVKMHHKASREPLKIRAFYCNEVMERTKGSSQWQP
jgi:hypothetical protein